VLSRTHTSSHPQPHANVLPSPLSSRATCFPALAPPSLRATVVVVVGSRRLVTGGAAKATDPQSERCSALSSRVLTSHAFARKRGCELRQSIAKKVPRDLLCRVVVLVLACAQSCLTRPQAPAQTSAVNVSSLHLTLSCAFFACRMSQNTSPKPCTGRCRCRDPNVSRPLINFSRLGSAIYN